MVLTSRISRLCSLRISNFNYIRRNASQAAVGGVSKWPESVRIVEVGARDGLQNEKTILPTAVKIDFINRLSTTGLTHVEATSYVSPKWVPQMGDSKEVMDGITRAKGVTYPVLVPNLKGLETALTSGVTEVAVFGSASEAFSLKNNNSDIEQGTKRCMEVTKAALAAGLKVRGYVSCVIACPYQGIVEPEVVTKVSAELFEAGCYEISLGDTIGVGTPGSVERVLTHVTKHVPTSNIAMHCHDTYGQALANILISLQMGVTVFDSSVAGLGGCPFAKGATGNVATEDLIYMLTGLGIKTGVDLDQMIECGEYITSILGLETRSRVGRAKAKLGRK